MSDMRCPSCVPLPPSPAEPTRITQDDLVWDVSPDGTRLVPPPALVEMMGMAPPPAPATETVPTTYLDGERTALEAVARGCAKAAPPSPSDGERLRQAVDAFGFEIMKHGIPWSQWTKDEQDAVTSLRAELLAQIDSALSSRPAPSPAEPQRLYLCTGSGQPANVAAISTSVPVSGKCGVCGRAVPLILDGSGRASMHPGQPAAPSPESEPDEWGELERLAGEAAPGPWEYVEHPYGGGFARYVFQIKPSGDRWMITQCMSSDRGPSRTETNARFIAAANPETVLRLLRALREARGGK